MTTDLIFYTNPMSRGRIVRWMLEEVGQPYDTRVIELGPELKSEAYLAVNPMGKLPAIVHRGQVVTECAAICAYLADAFPEAELAPPLTERADYYRWLFFAAGPLEQAGSDRSRDIMPNAAEQRFLGYGHYERVIDTLETTIAGTDYLASDRFSAADLYVGAHLSFGMQFGTIPKRDAFVTYLARLEARPPFKRAAELDDALLPAA